MTLPSRRRLIGAAMAGASAAALRTRAYAASRKSWDYIIIGGGSAGCVLAHRLSEDLQTSVLLIEAGPAVHDRLVDSPPDWPRLMGGPYDWNYQSLPQSGLQGRILAQPRGRGLGGSSLINALGFQRGPAGAYDSWARRTGDPGWSAAGLLPYFKRLETASMGADAYRGGTGPLHVLALDGKAPLNPLARASHAGAIAIGYPENPDWNGAHAEGAIWAQYSMRNLRRDDAATAYLAPIRDRPNLHILTDSPVLRLVFAGNHCAGVQLATRDAPTLHASRETILSAGAIDSPRLLMLSGLGPADALKRLGIAPIADLPGIGQNLHDHPLAPGLLFAARRAIPPSRYNHCETMAVGRTSQSPGWSDMQLMTLSIPFLSPTLGTPPADSFSIVPALTYPRSRGSLTLQNADHRTPPRIDPAYLADTADVQALAEGMEMGRALAASPPMRGWIARELFPGPHIATRRDMEGFVRRIASPFFHPVSTCAMGGENDAQAVVTADCRLRGIQGLRVVDASIFPSVPQAMTNAAVMAVAERAADLIRGRHAA